MIKTVIIEDEQNTLDVLKRMLHLINSDLNIVGDTGYVEDAVTLIEREEPQLIFMDIELEDGTGFDVLEHIDSNKYKIIFTTAYNQYAIKAFKFSAVDYLLKPINPEELQTAVERAITSINEKENYHELLNRVTQKSEKNIVLKTAEQRYVVPISTIVRLEADGAYTVFITENKKLIVSKNLKYYQELLDEDFIRCHQSHLVRKQSIKSINNEGLLHLSNGDSIPISRRNKADIIKFLK